MKFARIPLAFICATALVSCADMDMYPPQGGGGYPPPDNGYGNGNGYGYGNGNGYGQATPPPNDPPRQTPNYGSDYPPNLATEYRSGFEIGQKDVSVGYPRDSRRAYERFGGGYESYFQEGYADGYDGRQMAH